MKPERLISGRFGKNKAPRPKTRRCCDCRKYKEWRKFPKSKNCKFGYNYLCKLCSSSRTLAWQKANPEKHRIKGTTWKQRNAKKANKKQKLYYISNRKKILARQRDRYIDPGAI